MLLGVDHYCLGERSASQMMDGSQFIWTPNRETSNFYARFKFLKADGPPPGAGRSAVHFCSPHRTKTSSVWSQTWYWRSGPFAAQLSAQPKLGKMAITFNSDFQIRWSRTLWKAYSEDYTTQLNKWSKTKWINPEFHSKIQPIVRNTTKNHFSKAYQLQMIFHGIINTIKP